MAPQPKSIGGWDSLDIKSTGVAKTLLQNGTKVTLDEIDSSGAGGRRFRTEEEVRRPHDQRE
jgi:hypothetical protein